MAPATAELIPVEALRAMPGYREGDLPVSVQPLTGGGSLNHCLLLELASHRQVLRLRRDRQLRPGAELQREWAVQQLAAAAGLAPKVLAASVQGGWLLMDYVSQPMWTVADLQDPSRIDALGHWLAALQTLPPPQMTLYDPGGVVQQHVAYLTAQGGQLALQALDLQKRAQALMPLLQSRGVASVLCHGDLNLANLLGPKPLLVDWEYAQLADPLHDLACLLSYYPQIEPQLDRLLAAAGLASASSRLHLTAQVALFDIVNELWRLRHGS